MVCTLYRNARVVVGKKIGEARVRFVERKFSKFKAHFSAVFSSFSSRFIVWIFEFLKRYLSNISLRLIQLNEKKRVGRNETHTHRKRAIKLMRCNSSKNEFREFRNEKEHCVGYIILLKKISPLSFLPFSSHGTLFGLEMQFIFLITSHILGVQIGIPPYK